MMVKQEAEKALERMKAFNAYYPVDTRANWVAADLLRQLSKSEKAVVVEIITERDPKLLEVIKRVYPHRI